MTTPLRLLTAALCVLTLFGAGSRAQTNTTPLPKETAAAPVSADPVANEIALLRKSLQTLNARLREITEKVFSADAVPAGARRLSPRRARSLCRKRRRRAPPRPTPWRTRSRSCASPSRP